MSKLKGSVQLFASFTIYTDDTVGVIMGSGQLLQEKFDPIFMESPETYDHTRDCILPFERSNSIFPQIESLYVKSIPKGAFTFST